MTMTHRASRTLGGHLADLRFGYHRVPPSRQATLAHPAAEQGVRSGPLQPPGYPRAQCGNTGCSGRAREGYRAMPRKVIVNRSNSTICWLDRRPILTWTLLRRTVVNLSTITSLS